MGYFFLVFTCLLNVFALGYCGMCLVRRYKHADAPSKSRSTPSVPFFMREAVHRGARKLDKAKPTWWMSVDTSRLNLVLYRQCVLGQVFSTADLVLPYHMQTSWHDFLAQKMTLMRAFIYACRNINVVTHKQVNDIYNFLSINSQSCIPHSMVVDKAIRDHGFDVDYSRIAECGLSVVDAQDMLIDLWTEEVMGRRVRSALSLLKSVQPHAAISVVVMEVFGADGPCHWQPQKHSRIIGT